MYTHKIVENRGNGITKDVFFGDLKACRWQLNIIKKSMKDKEYRLEHQNEDGRVFTYSIEIDD